MSRWIFLFLLISSEAFSQSAGFVGGNDRDSFPAIGRLNLRCFDGQIKIIRCTAEVLDPSVTDYFVGPQGIAADKVVLTSTWEDGSTRKKDSKYENGKSKTRFNLWIHTLTQNPLLDLGLNKIQYTLTLKNKVVAEGEFTSQVTRLPAAICPPKTVNAVFPDDCKNIDMVCARYLQGQNYCQP